ncbi:hypothetical protein NE237_026927 [Protea cynaroides]|uniref:Uncharacterized protein n=1 Tax=Protea cynaroides TaxID=273540 RepID=A0A9Q0GPI1_9MAGN|nr:hypothetical protein NE237_026927 [Protea cynaroides]
MVVYGVLRDAVSVGWIPSHSEKSPNSSSISSGSVFSDFTVVTIKLEPEEIKIAETVAVVFQMQLPESASSSVTTEPSSPPDKSNLVEVSIVAPSKGGAAVDRRYCQAKVGKEEKHTCFQLLFVLHPSFSQPEIES